MLSTGCWEHRCMPGQQINKRNPTNSDIMRELKAQRENFNDMRTDVNGLLDWKQKMDWTKEAVDEYKRQEMADKATNTKQGILSAVKDMLPYISLILAGAAAIVYAHASSK